MRPTRTTLAAVTLAAGLIMLSRPQRLWSKPVPLLAPSVAECVLGPLSTPSLPSIDSREAEAVVDQLYAAQGLRRVRARVERGETLNLLACRSGASPQEAARFCDAVRRVFDPKRARAGDAYELLVDAEGRIRELRYEVNPAEVYRAAATPGGWEVTRLDIPVERRQETLAGRLTDSLYESFLVAGAEPDLVMSFVELFSWDVDFAKEAQEGDEFRVVYEKSYAQGRPVGSGRILAATYRDSKEEHLAVFFKDKGVEGYFDAKGQNVKKSFLRSPLKVSHISSRFSLARRHPVLDVVRPHRGVDYAAPAGTPVRSVADGRIVEAGWKGQAGVNVTIRHARGYETCYNHLSRLPKGVRAGVGVKQGQVIGLVGSTGLSTGPHLDFRVKKVGKWVDPLKEKYVGGDPVPAPLAKAYREWSRQWLARLEAASPSIAVAQLK